MNKFRVLLLLALVAVMPLLAVATQAAPIHQSAKPAAEMAGCYSGCIQIDHPWYNYDGSGNVYAATYAYDSVSGHTIEAETCIYTGAGTQVACAYDWTTDSYGGLYVVAAVYTHGANSNGFQSWSWMRDDTVGVSTSGWSSCCYVTFRHI